MQRRSHTKITLLAGFSLVTILACSGGGGNSPTSTPPTPTPNATKLHYTNNANTTSWRLELESGQDTGHLVLKLMPPVNLVAKGVSFFLSCDGVRTSWVSALPGPAFDLGSAPQIFRAKAGATSADYQVGLYQKTGTANLGTLAVARMTLDLKSGALPGTASVTPTIGKTGVYLDSSNTEQPIKTILVGELRAE